MKFVRNDSGLEELLSSMGANALLHEVAEGVASDWQRNDPRHDAPEIQVSDAQRERGVGVVYVYTNDSLYHLIEYGSVNNPPYRPATRAAMSAGIDFKDTGR